MKNEEMVLSNIQARTGRLEPLLEHIQKAAKEVCDMHQEGEHREREIRWWNEDVQRAGE